MVPARICSSGFKSVCVGSICLRSLFPVFPRQSKIAAAYEVGREPL
jgi:hypothetical protein